MKATFSDCYAEFQPENMTTAGFWKGVRATYGERVEAEKRGWGKYLFISVAMSVVHGYTMLVCIASYLILYVRGISH